MKLHELRCRYAKPPKEAPAVLPGPQPGDPCPKCHRPGALRVQMTGVVDDEFIDGARKGKMMRNEKWIIQCKWTATCKWKRVINPHLAGQPVTYPAPKKTATKNRA